MEQESQMIQGTVLAVIYQNPENGYCVLKVRTEQGEAVTVVGTIPMSVVGERLAIVGRWTRHQSFGQQFEAEFLERLMPETTSEILAFLSSRAVRGIGPKMAEKIVARFGDQSLNVLEQDPMQLTKIPGISEKKAQEMSESFQKQSGIRRLIEFLTIYHLPGPTCRTALPRLRRTCAGSAARRPVSADRRVLPRGFLAGRCLCHRTWRQRRR